jgi:hypothetical protein
LWLRQKTIGGAVAASICSTPYDAQKNMCSLEQLKALASTARQARAKYFSEDI